MSRSGAVKVSVAAAELMPGGAVVAVVVKREVEAVVREGVEVVAAGIVARGDAAVVASNGPYHITEEREEGNTSHVVRLERPKRLFL